VTRINSGIHPEELPDKLLLAEHREIKRIPNAILAGRYSLKDQPGEFTLGKGHVKFFYDKLEYLLIRYCELWEECIIRGFKVQDYSPSFENAAKMEGYALFNQWRETPEARKIVLDRIESKGFKLNTL
jgi:deoxyribonuclease (pyrimidine dimer)